MLNGMLLILIWDDMIKCGDLEMLRNCMLDIQHRSNQVFVSNQKENNVRLKKNNEEHHAEFLARCHRWYKKFVLHPTNELLLVLIEDHYKVLVPISARPALVYNMHNKHMHIGTPKVLDLLQNFTWPTLASDTKNFIQSCDLCRRRKGTATNQTPSLLHLARPSAPWQVCYMDFISFPEPVAGFKYALTYICGFSRFLITVPLRHERALDCAKALISNAFLPFSPPTVLSCDRGAAFTSELMKEACRIWGIDLKLHCAWRPQSTGVLERVHRILKDCIYITCRDKSLNWVQALPLVTKAINVSKNKAIGISPYQVIYGQRNQLGSIPDEMRITCDHPKTYAILMRLNLEKIYNTVKFYQEQTDAIMDKCKSKTPVVDIEPGDEVYLKRPRSICAKESRFKSVGPFVVISSNGSVVCLKDDSGLEDFVHRSHVHKKIDRLPEFNIFPNFLIPQPTLSEVEKPAADVIPPLLEITATDTSQPVETNGPVIDVSDPPRRYPKRNRRATSLTNIKSTKGQSYI